MRSWNARARLKKLIRENHESEERFRDLFDEAPIAYVNEELDSHFLRANKTAMRLLGIKPEDVPTTYGKSFVPETVNAQRWMREAFESIGKGIDTSGVVLEMRRKDNGKPFWIQWWSRPDPGGTFTRTMFIDITERVLAEQDRARLEAQNIYLQEEIRSQHNFVEIVGNSPALLGVLRQVDQIAPADSTTLIYGETGTGKELIARAIHDRSPRRERPLVKVNCGAISAGLVESELFGHVKGAFTGAITSRDGRFALADGGTIFLDEVGELPPETQVKLLRVLQEQEFEPIGGSKTVKVDVRVIAATNRDLPAMVCDGDFRSDLFYRLNVLPVTMPPLRERVEDIPLLTMFFLEKFARKLGRPIRQVAEETMQRLTMYSWPGNIRELQNVIERKRDRGTVREEFYRGRKPLAHNRAASWHRHCKFDGDNYWIHENGPTEWKPEGEEAMKRAEFWQALQSALARLPSASPQSSRCARSTTCRARKSARHSTSAKPISG